MLKDQKEFYSLAEAPVLADYESLYVDDCTKWHTWKNPIRDDCVAIMARLTGEMRAPKKGEWYISGAEPQAWRAPNNLTTKFHIAKLVVTKTEVVTSTVEWYTQGIRI